MKESYPKSEMQMTVTWGDSDPAGISYYARTFDWFTNGRLDFLNTYALPYMETFHYQGIALVCLHANCDYKQMVRPEERLTIQTLLTKLTRTRMTFTYHILNEKQELTQTGETQLAFTAMDGKSFNVAKRYPNLWEQLSRIWETSS